MRNKIIFLVFIAAFSVVFSSSAQAAYWVTNANSCPVIYQSQDCTPDVACGYTSGILYCNSPSTINAAVPASAVQQSNIGSGLGAGFVLDCLRASSSCLPWQCQISTTCDTNGRQTTCTGVGSFSCDGCKSTHLDCNDPAGDGSDGACEVTKYSTGFPYGSPYEHVVFAGSCSTSQCASSSYRDCDDPAGDGNNPTGCEIQIGEWCEVAANGASGTCSGCGSTGNDASGYECACTQSPPVNFQTGIQASYTTSNPLLYGLQTGSGHLISMTSTYGNATFAVNASGCIIFNDSTTQCTAGIGGGYWTETAGFLHTTNTSAEYRVGIGTSDPQYTLDVMGAVNASQFCINGDCRSSWTGLGGGGGTFYDKTPSTYTGSISYSGLTGYKAANAICDNEFPGSHMCNQMEIINTIFTQNVTEMATWTDGLEAWVSSGGAKYAPAPVPADDCGGWTVGTTSKIGNFWRFYKDTGGSGKAGLCNSVLSLACCM